MAGDFRWEIRRHPIFSSSHRVAEVAARLGVSGHSLYHWIKRYNKPLEQRQEDDDFLAENRRWKAELKRVSEERDILKKATVGMPPRTSPGSRLEEECSRELGRCVEELMTELADAESILKDFKSFPSN